MNDSCASCDVNRFFLCKPIALQYYLAISSMTERVFNKSVVSCQLSNGTLLMHCATD